jgi:hypothetical protein
VANSSLLYEAKWTPPTDSNGVLSWTVGPWRDTAGNTGTTLGQPPAIQFDTLTPVVNSLQIMGDSTDQRFKAGETIEAHVVFSEDMLVTGQPTLELQVGDQIRSASYIGRLVGSNATLVFRYVVQPGDTDTDGVSINADAIRLGTAGASIKDLFGNTAEIKHSSVAAAALAKVDTTPPTVSVSLIGGTDTALAQGETATLKLLFSEQPQALPLVATTRGSLSDWTRVSDTEYTAIYRPAANTSSGPVVWGMDTWKDLAGNTGTMLGNWPGLTASCLRHAHANGESPR